MTDGEERRESDRHSIPTEIEFWCDATHHRGRIEDLSEGGVYIFTGLSWPAGTEMAFAFVLPDGTADRVIGTGTVAWSEQTGIGVRFDSLDDTARARIRALVDRS